MATLTIPDDTYDRLAARAAVLDTTVEQLAAPVLDRFAREGAGVDPHLSPTSGDVWTPELDRRRCDLIDRDIDGTITPDQRAELAGLQAAMHRWLDAVAPLPLAAARELHRQLIERVAAGGRAPVTVPFHYPSSPHVRRHGPKGYSGYESYRPWLRDEFSFRCVYCLRREQWGRVTGEFAIDHFLPSAHHPGRAGEYDNLLYACASCNLAKGDDELPDPLAALTTFAVTVGADGTTAAVTGDARRIVRKLGLDRPAANEYRALWVAIVRLAAAHDPELFRRLTRYPDDLPDLSALDPPGGNTRPDGIAASCLTRQREGTLPETY